MIRQVKSIALDNIPDSSSIPVFYREPDDPDPGNVMIGVGQGRRSRPWGKP